MAASLAPSPADAHAALVETIHSTDGCTRDEANAQIKAFEKAFLTS